MKFIAVILLVSTFSSGLLVHGFVAPTAHQRASTAVFIGRESNVDLSGNAWKPDSEKMGVSDDSFCIDASSTLLLPFYVYGDDLDSTMRDHCIYLRKSVSFISFCCSISTSANLFYDPSTSAFVVIIRSTPNATTYSNLKSIN